MPLDVTLSADQSGGSFAAPCNRIKNDVTSTALHSTPVCWKHSIIKKPTAMKLLGFLLILAVVAVALTSKQISGIRC